VDSGFVREGVRANDCLVRRYSDSGDLRQQAARRIDLVELDVCFDAKAGLAHTQGDNDFLERGIPGAFADAVDGAFDLPHASAHRSQGVRHAEEYAADVPPVMSTWRPPKDHA